MKVLLNHLTNKCVFWSEYKNTCLYGVRKKIVVKLLKLGTTNKTFTPFTCEKKINAMRGTISRERLRI